MCAELYEIVHNITSILVRECFEAIENHVRSLVFEKPTLAHILKNASDFEEFHGILYVFSAIDGSCVFSSLHLLEIRPYVIVGSDFI